MAKARSVSVALSEEDRAVLGDVAQSAVEQGFESRTRPGAHNVREPRSQVLHEPCGAFVTLSIGKALRGCIGSVVTRQPLYLTIAQMAYAAAFEDPRFTPLGRHEWPRTSMEISVLSVPELCPDADLIEVGRHGLVLLYNGRSGVFLPQVPLEQGWQRQQYLEALCAKANVPPKSWKEPGAELYWYEALVFPVRHRD